MREVAVLAGIVALPGCLIGDPDGVPTPPPPPSFEKVITFAQPLANTVVGIRLANDPDLAAHARGRFNVRDEDRGWGLGWQLERWDADGNLMLWVQPGTVGPTERIRLVYGGTGTSGGFETGAGGWPDVVGVWHLSDDAAPFRDASGHDHDGAAVSAPAQLDGIAAKARVFDGFDDAIVFDNYDGTMNAEYGSFTFSAWVDVATPARSSEVAFSKRNATGGGYELDAAAGATVSDGAMTVTASFGTPATDRWVLLAAVVDRQAHELRTYVDGTLSDTRDITGLDAVHADGKAHTGTGTSAFRGALDELRIELRALDVTELRRRYLELVQPDLVYSVGPEQPAEP